MQFPSSPTPVAATQTPVPVPSPPSPLQPTLAGATASPARSTGWIVVRAMLVLAAATLVALAVIFLL
jgi:hypothetical protein